MELLSDSFTREFEAQLDALPEAKRALARLENKGCARMPLLLNLQLYSNRSLNPRTRKETGIVKEFVLEKRSLANKASRFADRLLRDASEVETFNRHHDIWQQITLYAFPPTHVAEDMRAYASRLKDGAGKLRDRYKRAIKEAPSDIIRWIEDYVKGVTGENHREEIAALIQAASAVYGLRAEPVAEDVRKKTSRSRRRAAGIRTKRRLRRTAQSRMRT